MEREYIVPVFIGCDFIGNAFFVGNYLITAYHVLNNKSNIKFRFKGEWYEFDDNCLLLKEYPQDFQEQASFGYQLDLAVYKMNDKLSPLEFEDVNTSELCRYLGYNYLDEGNIDFVETNDIKVSIVSYHYPLYGNPIRLNNVLSSYKSSAIEGNSGGPLFQNGKVVGMLVAVNGHRQDLYIDSRYIRKRIVECYNMN